MIVAREFNDENKLNGFINYVLTTNFAATNKLRNKFEKVVKDIAKEYRKELENEEKLFENFRKNKDYIRLFNGVENELYPSDKTRILNYTTILTEPDKTKVNTILSNLFSGNNTANKSEFFIQDIQTGLFNLKFN
jgi:hypothetical protein